MLSFMSVHTSQQNRSALPGAPVVPEPVVAPGPVARLAAAGLLGVARLQVGLAQRLDPRSRVAVQTRPAASARC